MKYLEVWLYKPKYFTHRWNIIILGWNFLTDSACVTSKNFVLTIIEEFSSKIRQIHSWYFWEKQISLTEFIRMYMGKQNLDLKKKKCICGSYLDLNFTLLLALMEFCTIKLLETQFLSKSGFIWFWNWALQLQLHSKAPEMLISLRVLCSPRIIRNSTPPPPPKKNPEKYIS